MSSTKAGSILRLSEAEVGKEYLVEAVRCGNSIIKRRILDMGIIPGCKIKVLRTAPLGDPIEIQVKGFPLSIRRLEAACIMVKEVRR